MMNKSLDFRLWVRGFVDEHKPLQTILTWGEFMARRKMTAQQQIEKGLSELAFGSCSDAIKLLFMSDEEIMQRLPKLKLINISEIKRPKGGGMEIKFFDRIKAFERLMDAGNNGADGSLSFYEALEKSARSTAEDDRNG